MLDFDQTYFGCGNKYPAGKLRSLLDENDYSFLLPDNEAQKVNDGYLYSTIDTVFPFIDDIDIYCRATVLHCANDLFCSGVKPIQASISVGISGSLNQIEVKKLFNSLQAGIQEVGITTANYHTFRADQTSITIAMNGIDNIKKGKASLDGIYELYLTKPIGIWSTKDIHSKSENWDYCINNLLINNSNWLEFLKSDCVKYSTDVSGFGLVGHLVSILQDQSYSAEISLKSIIAPLKKYISNSEHYLGCSAKSNVESFFEYLDTAHQLDSFTLDVLFGGEVNGPILVAVKKNFADVQTLNKLVHIGTISPRIGNSMQILKVRD